MSYHEVAIVRPNLLRTVYDYIFLVSVIFLKGRQPDWIGLAWIELKNSPIG